MRRALPGAVTALILATLVITFTLWWPHVRNETFVLTGTRDETGGWYGFWSGFAGGVRVFEWFAIAGIIYYHHTCHNPRCIRLGRYQAAGGVFRLCRYHHPDLKGSKPHQEMIHRLHHEWKAPS